MVKELTLISKKNIITKILIDDDDYDRIQSEKWHLTKRGYIRNNEMILIHRYILNLTNKKIQVDHINQNKLDNRKENLRICDSIGNNRNRNKFNRITTSKYKGVHWNKKRQNWKASISLNYNKKSLMESTSEIEAAEHYDYYAIKYFGEFACLNFPEKNYSNFIPKQLKAKTSIYKSVSWYKNYSKWLSFITYNKKVINLGYFLDEKDAAHHSDYLNWFLFKNKSKLNFPEVDYDKYIPTKLNSNTLKLINYEKI